MVAQVITHIGLSSTTGMPSDCNSAPGPIPDKLQQLRRVDRAPRQDHLGARPQTPRLAAPPMYSTPTARPPSITTRVASAPVITRRLERFIAGRRKARAAEFRRAPLIVIW